MFWIGGLGKDNSGKEHRQNYFFQQYHLATHTNIMDALIISAPSVLAPFPFSARTIICIMLSLHMVQKCGNFMRALAPINDLRIDDTLQESAFQPT